MKDHLPIYTDLTITAIGQIGLKRYFNSIRRNLPEDWSVIKKQYDDKDCFFILDDVFCLQTSAFKDTEKNLALRAYIYLGLTSDSIIILKIELTLDLSKEESLPAMGYVCNIFHESVLKSNKFYNSFSHDFKFGGPADENWFRKDLRDQRTIKLFSKADAKTWFLAESKTATVSDKTINYSTPNNIALSLSLMKKSLKRGKEIFRKLILKNPKKKIELSDLLKSELFDYFEEIQTSIIFSYISVEGFSNAAIPSDYLYEKINEKGIKEIWNKENIQRWMSTSEKVSLILPIILKATDIKLESFWNNFKELEKLRNEIVHQKTIEKGNKLDVELYSEMLNPIIFNKISSSLKVISFFYKFDNAHPYFPLGLGIAKFQVSEIESFEKHFKVLEN